MSSPPEEATPRRRQDSSDFRFSKGADPLAEIRWRQLMNHSPYGIVVYRPDGTIKTWNPAIEQLFGLTKAETSLLVKKYNILDDPQLDERGQAELVRKAFVGVSCILPTSFYRSETPIEGNMVEKWLEGAIFPVLDGDGGLQEVVLVHSDVTQLVETRLNLQRSKDGLAGRLDELEQLYATTPVGLCLIDTNLRFLRINERLAEISGRPPAEHLGRSLSEVLPAIAQGLEPIHRRVIESGQPVLDFEIHGSTPAEPGRQRDWLVSCYPLRSRDGAIIAVSGVVQEITERKQASEALAASEARHRFLTQNISDAIWTLDLNRRFTYVSPSVERLLGYTAEEVQRIPLNEILADSSLDIALQVLADELERDGGPGVDPERTRAVDLHLKCRDGSLIWTESKMSFLRDEKGAPAGVLGVTRDISTWKATQEALRRSEDRLRQSQRLEAIGQLAGGVAHDFNNLLTVILGNADMAVSQCHGDDPRRARLEEIGKAARKAASLTRQLLAFARRQRLEPTVLSLNDIVTETEPILKRLMPEDIRMVTVLDPGLWSVEADRGQIEQVLLNLTVNARDAMPRGGKVEIATSNVDLHEGFDAYEPHVVPGPYVRLLVTDEGGGIAEELLPKIFEPFFTTKPVGEGTGMGLATVYGIIKQSRGYVWATNREGRGAAFEILLPRSGGTRRVQPDYPADAAVAGGSERLLLVEDDASVRILAGKILTDAGYSVLEAASGHEAMDICAKEGGRIDLVVTDMVMPQMSGDELAGRLRGAFPRIRVLYMSGYGDRVHHRRWQTLAGPFLDKPFTPDRLLAKVREVLDLSHGRAAS